MLRGEGRLRACGSETQFARRRDPAGSRSGTHHLPKTFTWLAYLTGSAAAAIACEEAREPGGERQQGAFGLRCSATTRSRTPAAASRPLAAPRREDRIRARLRRRLGPRSTLQASSLGARIALPASHASPLPAPAPRPPRLPHCAIPMAGPPRAMRRTTTGRAHCCQAHRRGEARSARLDDRAGTPDVGSAARALPAGPAACCPS